MSSMSAAAAVMLTAHCTSASPALRSGGQLHLWRTSASGSTRTTATVSAAALPTAAPAAAVAAAAAALVVLTHGTAMPLRFRH